MGALGDEPHEAARLGPCPRRAGKDSLGLSGFPTAPDKGWDGKEGTKRLGTGVSKLYKASVDG